MSIIEKRMGIGLLLLAAMIWTVSMFAVPAWAQHGETGVEQASHGEITASENAMESAGHSAEAEGLSEEHSEESGEGHMDLGKVLPLWSILPFIGILLSIALFPLFAPNFWHHHYPKISILWALLFAIPFLLVYKGAAFHEILHIYLADYIPFIILLWGLFTASGGILLTGSLAGTPAVNLLLLVIGTILASWMGTTGASMVLIRPVLRANHDRKNKMHVVIFFIFLVSNIGGSLTPWEIHPCSWDSCMGFHFSGRLTFSHISHLLRCCSWLFFMFWIRYFINGRKTFQKRIHLRSNH